MLCYKKKSLLSLALVVAVAGSAQTTQTASISPANINVGDVIETTINKPLLLAGGIIVPFLAYCIFSYNCKVPNKNFKARYSLRFKDLKFRIRSMNDFTEQIRYIMKNIYWIVEDGIIGIPGNSSRSIRVDPVTKKVNVKERSLPAGIIGWTKAYSKPILNTAKTPFELGKTVLQVAAGIFVWQNMPELIEALRNTVKEFATGENMEKGVKALAEKAFI